MAFRHSLNAFPSYMLYYEQHKTMQSSPLFQRINDLVKLTIDCLQKLPA